MKIKERIFKVTFILYFLIIVSLIAVGTTIITDTRMDVGGLANATGYTINDTSIYNIFLELSGTNANQNINISPYNLTMGRGLLLDGPGTLSYIYGGVTSGNTLRLYGSTQDSRGFINIRGDGLIRLATGSGTAITFQEGGNDFFWATRAAITYISTAAKTVGVTINTNSVSEGTGLKISCTGLTNGTCLEINSPNLALNVSNVLWVNGTSGELTVVGDQNLTGNFSGNQFYGETSIHPDGNITVVINTQNVHENITGFNETKLNGFTLSGNNSLITDVAGRYEATYWVSLSGGVNILYSTCLAVNNEHVTPHAHRKQGASGDVGSMSGGGILDLNVGDIINLQIRNEDGNQNVDIFFAGMRLVRIGD